jgi:hypothetical protein
MAVAHRAVLQGRGKDQCISCAQSERKGGCVKNKRLPGERGRHAWYQRNHSAKTTTTTTTTTTKNPRTKPFT